MTSTLIVAHRRLDTAQQVAESVINSGVMDVWAWVDGPRTPAEAEQTAAVASLLRHQSWPGDFHLRENTSNHGVANAVPAALEWIFAQRDEVVVLEDDCVPTPEFFTFVDLMLERYRSDPTVALVCGTRIAPPSFNQLTHPYDFSIFPLIWGWATWRSRWQHYRHDIRGWQERVSVRRLAAQGGLLHAWDWYRLFNSVATDHPWSWDYQLTYMLWSRQELALIPPIDLVRNVGFGELASHTATEPYWAPHPPQEAARQAAMNGIYLGRAVPVAPSQAVDSFLRKKLFSPPLRERIRRRLPPFTVRPKNSP